MASKTRCISTWASLPTRRPAVRAARQAGSSTRRADRRRRRRALSSCPGRPVTLGRVLPAHPWARVGVIPREGGQWAGCVHILRSERRCAVVIPGPPDTESAGTRQADETVPAVPIGEAPLAESDGDRSQAESQPDTAQPEAAQPDTAPRHHPRLLYVTLPGLWGALIASCLSFTPSLLPRTGIVQGLVWGISAAIGYGFGVLGACIWRAFADRGARRSRRRSRLAFAYLGDVLLVGSFALGQYWQYLLRDMMGVKEYNVLLVVASPL